MKHPHKIRVTVEIVRDGFNASVKSDLLDIPALMPIGSAAKFALADALQNQEFAKWHGDNPPRFVPKRAA